MGPALPPATPPQPSASPPMPPIQHTGRAAAWLATALLLAVACNPDATTGPSRATAPSLSLDAPDDGPPGGGGTLGPIPIPIPETNYGSGAVGWMGTGMTIPAYTAFIVEVVGNVNLEPNPKVAECWPDHLPPYGEEGSYGPLGRGSQLSVGIGFQYVRNGALGWIYGGIGGDGGSTAHSDTAFVDRDVEVFVSRSGLFHEIGGMVNCPPQGFYLMKGQQLISVTMLDGIGLDISPKVAIVKRGTNVTFTASASDGSPITAASWLFVPTREAPPFGVCGPNPCPITVTESGELRVWKELRGRMRSVKAAVRVYSSFALTASESAVNEGDAVIFTPMIDGEPGLAARWLWRGTTGATVVDPCGGATGKCLFTPPYTGTMWAYTASGGGDSASAPVTVKRADDDRPLTITMLFPDYPLPDKSFTTIPGENVVELNAETSDPSRDGEIRWEVVDDVNDHVESGQPATPDGGPKTAVTIPQGERPSREGTARWLALQGHHPGTLDRKALRYRVRAYVDDKGKRIFSDSIFLTQNVVDVLRQEYVDFAQPRVRWPSRDVLRAPSGSANFPTAKLIEAGDFASFGLGWVAQPLIDGLEETRMYYHQTPKINAGYRDPAHNWVHVGLDQGYRASPTSNHMYGYAADLFTNRDPAIFYDLSRAGARAGACMEPPEKFFTDQQRAVPHSVVRNWDHAHVDWDPMIVCPAKWVEFRNTMIGPE